MTVDSTYGQNVIICYLSTFIDYDRKLVNDDAKNFHSHPLKSIPSQLNELMEQKHMTTVYTQIWVRNGCYITET